MLRVLVATPRPKILRSLVETLSSDPEVDLRHVASGTDALSAVSTFSPHLVVIDFNLPDIKPLNLVSELLQVNAMVNTAVVSPLSDPEFHEASEGLGVLAKLPLEPDSGDAAHLLEKLRGILGLSKPDR
jgi:DNA-binding response OmpR family regulator